MFYCLSRNQELMMKVMRQDHEIFENRLRQLEALITFYAKAGRLNFSQSEVKDDMENTSPENSSLPEEIPLQMNKGQAGSLLGSSSQPSLANPIFQEQTENFPNLTSEAPKREASSPAFKKGLLLEEDPIAAAAAAGRILRTDGSSPQSPSRSGGILKDISLDFDSKPSVRTSSKENGMPELKL